ncbi:MAG TPA: hypothetical protein DCY79_13175 [Planctomycetaceae bacterium]|nr:hypothetical protein [Blastopirellula sp.]HAY80752.1 hypothetical protein [Planctomycetaceae bacterium]
MQLRTICVLSTIVLLSGMDMPAEAAPPWLRFIPFKQVDADPAKTYDITEEGGPWMIMAAAFAGPGAEEQADELILELRKSYKLEAYKHNRTFDFTQRVKGLGVNKYGHDKVMKHKHSVRFDEFAVLIGNFQSVNDPRLEKTLEKIKKANPNALDPQKRTTRSTQRHSFFLHARRYLTKDPNKQQFGPMGRAFATTNPLLPEEFFSARGVDPLVLKMNKNVEHSLLENPGKYTVKVATFRGAATMDPKEIEQWNQSKRVSDRLIQAEINANELTLALRRQGIEAYQFHDRHESIVTVGNFQSLGEQLPNGAINLNPAVRQIITSYSATKTIVPGSNQSTIQPKKVNGIALDVEPVPVEVPKKSIGSIYAQR